VPARQPSELVSRTRLLLVVLYYASARVDCEKMRSCIVRRRITIPAVLLRCALVCVWLALGLVAVPSGGRAQDGPPLLHATLRGWADYHWLHILNRSGARGGRFSDLGILRRFHPDTETEYVLNLISNRFTLSENYDWYRRDRGFRWVGGSVTSQGLMQSMEFKIAVPITGGWNADVWYNREANVPANLDVMRIAIGHRWQSGLYVFAGPAIVTHKPDADVLLGAGWRSTSGAPGEFSLTFGALDRFNNYVYDVLGVPTSDTTLIYEQYPHIVRATAEFEIASRIRIEGHAALQFPSTLRAFVKSDPDSGFEQVERFGYAGGLLEYTIERWGSVGTIFHYVRAETERSQLPKGLPEDNFTRTESEMWLGAYLLLRPFPFLEFEGWLARNWRPEELQSAAGSPRPDIDYEDRAWSGMATLTYGKATGFTADLGLVYDVREIVRGAGQLPTDHDIGRSNTRLRMDVGWRLDRRAYVYIGTAFDLDAGSVFFKRGPPDGYRARFVVHF